MIKNLEIIKEKRTLFILILIATIFYNCNSHSNNNQNFNQFCFKNIEKILTTNSSVSNEIIDSLNFTEQDISNEQIVWSNCERFVFHRLNKNPNGVDTISLRLMDCSKYKGIYLDFNSTDNAILINLVNEAEALGYKIIEKRTKGTSTVDTYNRNQLILTINNFGTYDDMATLELVMSN